MASTACALPLTEVHVNGQYMKCDKPSPLRIPKKAIRHNQQDVISCTSDSTDHSAKDETDAKEEGHTPMRAKRRRPSDVHVAAGKENHVLDVKPRPSKGGRCDDPCSLQGAKRWAWDGSLPRELAFGRSASCGIRRAVKARPLLSNLCDASTGSSFPCSVKQGAMTSPGLKTEANGLSSPWRPDTAYVLAPHVQVTSEVAALAAGHHTWWAAIEITGRLSPVLSGEANLEAQERSDCCIEPHIRPREGAFEFGSLDDLRVEVLPTGNSSIIQVLCEQTFPNFLRAGSSILILAQVQIEVKKARPTPKPLSGLLQQNSADLMEDLAAELGDLQVAYSHIRVSYRHSAFPTFRDETGLSGGVSSVQSRVDTVATASVNIHNTLSPWSPPQLREAESLFPLIERNWGAGKAKVAMQQMGNRGCTPSMSGHTIAQPSWSQLDVDWDNDAEEIAMLASSDQTAPLGGGLHDGNQTSDSRNRHGLIARLIPKFRPNIAEPKAINSWNRIAQC
ncbi:hypothetical protein B0J13DRAFT_523053 [Dactylonectria estremocensis]|uniref:Uncharacterized protein n=1 Tax=Dactylonectria estremocensis TaxID=1079267 RepID=A0A9P9F1A5_9HYPO|nr:hypothetical protein B0J13DRAFT_523053 [Dactylonectria estremocensis]